jgi:hypothetical protein
MLARSFTILALTVACFQARAQSIYTPYAFTNFAGMPGVVGSSNATGSAASFSRPHGVALDVSGNLYVADTQNHTIRKITPDGVVTTLAGTAGKHGTVDGTNSVARFYAPRGLAIDGTGNIYVGDFQSSTIRKVAPVGTDWVVTTVAGIAGTTGTNDGPGTSAQFAQPLDLAADSSGIIYVADTSNLTIRKITPDGTGWAVTTLAGNPGHQGIIDGTGGAAQFSGPQGITADHNGNVFVADGPSIRKVTSAGGVTTLAGCPAGGCTNAIGSADGSGTEARFGLAGGVAVDGTGSLYICDFGNKTIRKMTPTGSDWLVTTLAGSVGQTGATDGVGSEARFSGPAGVAVGSTGILYVSDFVDDRIAKGTVAPTAETLQFATDAGRLTVSNNFFQTLLIGPPGSNAVVETSANLQSWTPIRTNVLPASGLSLSVPMDTNASRLFRARLVP